VVRWVALLVAPWVVRALASSANLLDSLFPARHQLEFLPLLQFPEPRLLRSATDLIIV
jgi:hypothetical protein